MKKKFLIVAAAFIGSQLTAQEDTTVKTLDEVVMTANKFPQKQSGTGKLITVITKEQIMQSGGKDLSQILNEQAGVVVNGANSNPGKDKSIFFRGATDKYTLLLLDGVPLNDPSGVGGSFDLRLLSLDNIERIEILKGSQSTLYGSNAVAGVINIISKKPVTKNPQFKGLLSYGSYNSFKANTSLSQKTKVLEYDVNYVYNTTDGISEAKDKIGNGNFDKDGFTKHAVQTILGVNLTDKLKLSPYYRFTEFKGDYDAGSFEDAPNHYTASLVNTGLNGQYTYKGGTLYFNYGYDFTKRNYTSQWGTFIAKGKFHHAEAYTDYSLSNNVHFVGGLNYQSYRMDMPDTTNSIMSPYASFYIKTAKGFNAELGGRWNHHNQYGDNFTYSINPSYLVKSNLKLFINITSGFRAPSVNELFGPFGANPHLKPEKSNTQEAGLQATIAEKKLELTVTGFNRSINDVIIYGFNGYENRDKQHDYGTEFEAGYSINKKINIKVNYAYVDGKVIQKLASKDTTYYNLIRRPKHNVHLFAGYQVSKNLFISSSLQVTGKRVDYDFSSFPASAVDLKGYALWNFYTEYSFLKKKLNIFADIKNITNKKDYYEVYGYNVQGINVTGGLRFQL
ncbi:MAG TPA: TonB-dependent receptor [Chitinophagaceae bacterium]|nr:TonB-dependent receptor [Chitinophagaceae bacterium]